MHQETFAYRKNTPHAWEFYDLVRDPQEMHNRYRDPNYQKIIRGLKADLIAVREEIGDADQDHPRIREIIKANWDG